MHAKSLEIFNKLFQRHGTESVACDIHQTLIALEADVAVDNSIGENFNQLLHNIRENWLKDEQMGNKPIQFYLPNYIFWLYMVTSRADEIFKVLDPKNAIPYIRKKKESLNAFKEITLWSNFIRHPKEFIFCHWPTQIMDERFYVIPPDSIFIDTAYLEKHYNSKSDQRPEALCNNASVIIQYPNIVNLTEGFVNDFFAFVDFICDNTMLAEALAEKSNLRETTGTPRQ